MSEQLPFQKIFWANTQKHAPNNYEERFRLFGAIIGPDDELMIIRHPLDLLGLPYQTEVTVASQTVLHLRNDDTRAVVPFKITQKGTGDVFQHINAAGQVRGKLTNAGAFTDASLREFKKGMRDLTDKQIVRILENVKIYRFEYLEEPGLVYVGPEAAEFHELTGYGDGTTISPKSVAGVALRLVQWVYKKVLGIEERLKAVEDRLAVTEGSDDAPKV